MDRAPVCAISQAFLRTFRCGAACPSARAANPSTCRAYSRTRYDPGVHVGMNSVNGDGKGPLPDASRNVLDTSRRWAFASAMDTRWTMSNTLATVPKIGPEFTCFWWRSFGVDAACGSLKPSRHEIRTLGART